MTQHQASKSVFAYAAGYGLWFGLYLTLMSACFLLANRVSSLPSLLLLLMPGLPVMTWLALRDTARREPLYRKVAPLWLTGIYSFIFGSLICALISAAYLLLIEPGFLHTYLETSVAAVEASPLAAEMAQQTEVMRTALEQHLVPTPMQFVFSMVWATAFLGSMLSLVIAIPIAVRPPRARQIINS